MDELTEEIQLSECDKEPLQFVGAIQNQGCMLIVRLDEQSNRLTICAASDNLPAKNWIAAEDVRGLMGADIFHIFEERMANRIVTLVNRFCSISRNTDDVVPNRNFAMLQMLCKGAIISTSQSAVQVCCSVVGCSKKNTFILELEEIEDALLSEIVTLPSTNILCVGDIVGRVRSAESMSAALSIFCDAVLETVPGFDRGMVYRFCDDMSGEVVYENVLHPERVSSSYLNLRFPAGDIPLAARKLYVRNPVRFISDVSGKNSRLVSNGDEQFDLTMSCLRACSPVHLNYLHNMGVTSSMSISIVIEGQLWGLFVFHSYSGTVKPNVELRIMFEMIVGVVAMRIDSSIREEAANRKLSMNSMLRALQYANNIHEAIRVKQDEILRIVGADALFVYPEGREEGLLGFGCTTIAPTAAGYEQLYKECQANSHHSYHASPHLMCGDGVGVLFFKSNNACCAFVRKAKVSDVNWGGAPDKIADPKFPGRLLPRASFELYVQEGRYEARKWSDADVEVATMFHERLLQCLHDQMLASFRLSLDQSNAECVRAIETSKQHYEFFAHMSHELRTPFHGVMSSLQILKNSGESLDAKERKEIIESAVECGSKMMDTLNDILTIAKGSMRMEVSRAPVTLSQLMALTSRIMHKLAINKEVYFVVERIKQPDASDPAGIAANSAESTSIVVNSTSSTSGGLERALQEFSDWKATAVWTDEKLIGQCANNLTSNAIKFTPAAGRVTIRADVLTAQQAVARWATITGKYEANYTPSVETTKAMDVQDSSKEGGSSSSSTSSNSSNNNNDNNSSNNDIDASEALLCPFDFADDTLLYFFEVEDTGPGVTYEDMCVMFNAYQQVSSGVTKTYQGTGLGLHICKMHAEVLNGVLSVAATPGVGTCFFFAVPVTLFSGTQSTVEVKPHARTKRVEVEGYASKEKLFLVVDDSSINVRLTKRKIELYYGTEHTTVAAAYDGTEAIQYVHKLIQDGKHEQLTGIFMDYHMPNCSGIEAIKEIRKLEKQVGVKRSTAIVAFTADSTERTKEVFLAAGANDVLPKPTPGNDLEQMCDNMIAGTL